MLLDTLQYDQRVKGRKHVRMDQSRRPAAWRTARRMAWATTPNVTATRSTFGLQNDNLASMAKDMSGSEYLSPFYYVVWLCLWLCREQPTSRDFMDSVSARERERDRARENAAHAQVMDV